MNWQELEPEVKKLQGEILQTMTSIKDLSGKDEKMPKPTQSFLQSKEMIDNQVFNVVVCGEVKKGKSSLLNAIVGKSYLPVNNEIATSQVFRITNSDYESFSLVFSDGSSKEISKEDLSKYGSQVDADLKGEPIFQGKELSYIQLNLPVAFLPKGVNLVDTPGLGALYKSHEYITQNYVKNASAVIFVLDPESPIVAKEKEFIEKVLSITPNILFVMTKIDQYSKEHVDEILNRDEEILSLIYVEHKLKTPEIYPISNTSLQKASDLKIEALRNANYKNSRFPEVKNQLMLMIYKAVGLVRTGYALREAAEQTTKIKKVITEVLQINSQDDLNAQLELKKQKDARKKELDNAWKEDGENYNAAKTRINDECHRLASRVDQIFSTTGGVYREYFDKIEALSSLEEAQELGRTMPQNVANDITAQWRNVAEETQERVFSIVAQVGAEMERATYGINATASQVDGISISELSMKDKITCFRNQYFTGSWLSSMGGGLIAALGIVSWPVAGVIAAVATALWGWFGGRDDSKARALEKNKNNFKKELNDEFTKLRSDLLHVKGSECYSVVEKFSRELSSAALNAIGNMLKEKQALINNQLKEMDEQSKADASKRKAVEQQWVAFKEKCEAIIPQIKAEVSLRENIATQLQGKA